MQIAFRHKTYWRGLPVPVRESVPGHAAQEKAAEPVLKCGPAVSIVLVTQFRLSPITATGCGAAYRLHPPTDCD